MLSAEDRVQTNYDEPAAIDLRLLLEHLVRLSHGDAVAKPVYSFDSHTCVGTESLTPAPLVIVEGSFTFWWHEIDRRLDLKVFVDAPADVRLVRRQRRDVNERGRRIDQALTQYVAAVRPMHERYVEPCRARADLVILNDGAVGLGPLEANACGVPVVAVAEGGVRETVIHAKNGLLCEPEPEAMASALASILEDAGYRRQLSDNGCALVRERWSLEAAVTRLEGRLAETLARQGSGRAHRSSPPGTDRCVSGVKEAV
jgi:glycosyltransferase involved in cell wall biosynthesis